MARTILLTGAFGWLLVAVAGLGVALAGRMRSWQLCRRWPSTRMRWAAH